MSDIEYRWSGCPSEEIVMWLEGKRTQGDKRDDYFVDVILNDLHIAPMKENQAYE